MIHPDEIQAARLALAKLGVVIDWDPTAPEFRSNANRAAEGVWPMFAPSLAKFAERLTKDPDEQADLMQEALIKLWKVDPTRFDLHRDPEDRAYVYRILVNRMWHVWGGEKRRPEAMSKADEVALALRSFQE